MSNVIKLCVAFYQFWLTGSENCNVPFSDLSQQVQSSLPLNVGAVMVQATVSPAAPLVVWNLRNCFGTPFPIQIFYSSSSEGALDKWFGSDPYVLRTSLPERYMSSLGPAFGARDELQSLFTDASFWGLVPPHWTHALVMHDE